MIKMNDFSIKFSSTNVKFFLDSFMEEIKPVVTENYVIDKWDESILLVSFGVLGLSDSWCQEKNP